MKMPYKNPDSYGWVTHVLAILMTTIGTIASYSYKVLKGEVFSRKTFILQGFVPILREHWCYLPLAITYGLQSWQVERQVNGYECRASGEVRVSR